jgi:dTDP-glucose 4,6-dehydratase
LASNAETRVVNLDKLTYAGNLASLNCLVGAPNYRFLQADVCDLETTLSLLKEEAIDHVMHLAAETHVDRSVDGPAAFIQTNIVGTYRLLEAATLYWRDLPAERRAHFRFQHVSTDEVFGDLPFDTSLFSEQSPYAPSSPYSASKAAADHLVRSWHRTYGLPVIISNCSNNYGPFHFPEKLIPLTILNAIEEVPIGVYGNGANVRDWLFVEDHAAALQLIGEKGAIGESYNVGGRSEQSNLAVVQRICDLLDKRRPRRSGKSYRELITFVNDRPGHDRRYAIDSTKIERELGWFPSRRFEEGLAFTVDWFLSSDWWWKPLRHASKETFAARGAYG